MRRVEPALTDDLWRTVLAEPSGPRSHDTVFERGADGAGCHYIAALALHDQVFGFTREMVTWMGNIYDRAQKGCLFEEEDDEMSEAITARIEALLPPEERSP